MLLQRIWLYVIAFLVVASLTGGGVLAFKLKSTRPVEITLSTSEAKTPSGKVQIDGAVKNPGTFEAGPDSTLANLLNEAGPASDADLNSLRLYVPKTDETDQPQRVDINRAELWLLQALPGIGEIRAQAIVDYRTRNGLFRSVDDLLKVPGISSGTLERIRPLITIGD
ncbi:MAG: ComEA family DNA-binding protein [Chloroflexota bacterium]